MAVRALNFEPEESVVPHAIIWRPLKYFTMNIRDGEDDLDSFQGASFAIGNEIRFDLRSYREHPGLTVTLYLPEEIKDGVRISEMLDTVFNEMSIPHSAVAWRRGEAFEFGKLERRRDDRLHESEARILVLKIAAQQTGHAASTKFIKREIPTYTELSPTDRTPSKSRIREQVWQQIVGNVISHKKSATGPFVRGYAVENGDDLHVTSKGLLYLNNMGFSAFPISDFAE